MKWLVLLALVACTSKKVETTKTEEAVVAPTESDAKPVSPYTVKPCYCMKIFKPVCAENRNFGNSCEAECQGHKTWTEGRCPKK